jgi:6,7-dimethyl-8-ribityllumazine synthase
LGCIIKGETSHDVHIANWAAAGIGQVGLTTGIPTLFGVLTPNDELQAVERSRPGSKLNRGHEVAEAALEMIRLNRKGF